MCMIMIVYVGWCRYLECRIPLNCNIWKTLFSTLMNSFLLSNAGIIVVVPRNEDDTVEPECKNALRFRWHTPSIPNNVMSSHIFQSLVKCYRNVLEKYSFVFPFNLVNSWKILLFDIWWPKWPLTSIKNKEVLPHPIMHPHTKYEIHTSLLLWDIV